jgi:nucleotide-binding universal stress UspA family protein
MRPGGRRISRIRKLLVPVDGSPGGSVALQTAIDVVQATGASIHLLQVVVPIPMLAYAAPYDSSGAAVYDSAWDDGALVAASTSVAAVAARLRTLGVSVGAEARMAPAVADAIVETADQAGTDLMVMSTHALTGPVRAILGSVSDAVVRSAHCPVLLVHRAHVQQQAGQAPSALTKRASA